MENEEKSAMTRRLARNGGIVAAVALVLAGGAGLVLGKLLELPDGASIAEASVSPAERVETGDRASKRNIPRKLSKSSYADPIVRRNIFDSEAVGASYVPTGDPQHGRRTDLKVTLLATMVAVPETFSSALIQSGEKGGLPSGYGIGDLLLDEATILSIEQKKVYIVRSNGDHEYIDMDGEGVARTVATAEGEEDGEVSKTGDNSWAVDSSLVENALGNIDELVTQMRATPHKTDGVVDGFRLSAIRRGSVFRKLGIKNGDVVHSVNGMPLTDYAGAMSAFQGLQSDRSFSFDITRRGQKETFEYEIR